MLHGKKKDIEDIQDREIQIFVFGFEGMTSDKNHFGNENFMGSRSEEIFLDSSMVEHSAVNRVVVGSSPTRGVKRGLAQFRLVIIWAPWSSG